MRTHSIRSALAAAIVSTLLLPGEARSQEVPAATSPIAVGSKIRLLAPAVIQGTVQGTVMEMDDKSLLLSTENQRPFRVSREAISHVEIAIGRHRNVRKGLIIGAVVGAMAVATVAAIPKDTYCPPGDANTQSCLDGRSFFLVAGLPLAALEGAGVGALLKSDTWTSVPLEKVRVSLGPTRGHGLAASLSLRF